MANIYWTREVKTIMNNLIHNELDQMLDTGMDAETIADKIIDIREHKRFADDVIAVMEALDREEDEERAKRERQEARTDDAGGS